MRKVLACACLFVTVFGVIVAALSWYGRMRSHSVASLTEVTRVTGISFPDTCRSINGRWMEGTTKLNLIVECPNTSLASFLEQPLLKGHSIEIEYGDIPKKIKESFRKVLPVKFVHKPLVLDGIFAGPYNSGTAWLLVDRDRSDTILIFVSYLC
jgi:hypothetical protein